MKRTVIYMAVALVAALAMGAMAGCSSQSASSESASSTSESAAASESASAAAEQSQDEIIAELKDAIANIPAYKSVTITEEDTTTYTGEADGASDFPEDLTAKTVYKFDASGDKLKTSAAFEINGVKMQYISDGDDAVCITDGPVYSGTTQQFDQDHFAGAEAYLANAIGDLNTFVDCAASVEKLESYGLTAYTLTLDREKYVASDEVLTIMADSENPLEEAMITITFDEDGSIGALDKKDVFKLSTSVNNLVLSDYDSTVVDPLPEADKTYEEMEADVQEKMDELLGALDPADEFEDESAAAEAK